MKTRVFIIGLALVALFLIMIAACGKGKNSAGIQPVLKAEQSAQEIAAEAAVDPLTEEDYMVLGLSLEERWDYLFAKYQELVFDLHGVVLEYVPYPGKAVSYDLNNDLFKVEESETTTGEDKYDQIHEEDLKVVGGDPDEWAWTLTFMERLAGDYTWNGTANIADITPIADCFGDKWDPEVRPYPCWPDNDDPHLDRLGPDDSLYVINYPLLLTLAQNFGLQLVGYRVYFMSDDDDDWEEDGVFLKRLTTAANRTSGDYRGEWEYSFDGNDLYMAGATPISSGDLITVVPVFYDPHEREEVEGGENTRSGELELTVPTTSLPIPVLSANPLYGDAPLLVTFNGSSSYDIDGTVEAWKFDFGDGSPIYVDTDDGITTHTYTTAGYYYPKMWVQDDDENWSAGPAGTVITVTGLPAFTDFYVTPNPAETEQEVTFVVTAYDTNGTGLTKVEYDVDGDGTYEEEYEETPGDLMCEHTFSVEDLEGSHTIFPDSKVRVTDSEGSVEKRLSDFAVIFQVSHAVPVLSLTTDPEPAFILDDGTVEFDASASTDRDGPNGKPTRYEFDFGDESSYYEEDGDADDGTFDGITTHQYTSPGSYTAVIAVFDEMYGTEDCDDDELHTDSTEVEVRVYTTPTLESNDVVDDGSHHSTTWSSLGNESIALDINPATGLPGVVYYGMPGSPPVGCPDGVPLFAEKTALGWPAEPDLVYVSGQTALRIGEQCDLEYDTVLHGEGTSVPFIAATKRASDAQSEPGGPDLYLYSDLGAGWQCQILMDDDNVLVDYPIRLVKNNYGAYVHFVKQESIYSPYLAEISDTHGKNNEQTVESGPFYIGTSHDYKQYQDDYTSGTGGALYVVYYTRGTLMYELSTTSGYWTNIPVTLTYSNYPEVNTTRLCALDYFQDTGLGIVWIDDTGRDLNWNEYDGDWNNAYELADDDVGYWCDFDYDEGLGIPCVAYEQEVEMGHNMVYRIYVRVRINGTWSNPITVDTLGLGEESHLDLEVWNGYIYVAYSKGGYIYSAVLDFFDRS